MRDLRNGSSDLPFVKVGLRSKEYTHTSQHLAGSETAKVVMLRHFNMTQVVHASLALDRSSPSSSSTISEATKGLRATADRTTDESMERGGGSTGWKRTLLIFSVCVYFALLYLFSPIVSYFTRCLSFTSSHLGTEREAAFGLLWGLTLFIDLHRTIVSALSTSPPPRGRSGYLVRGGFCLGIVGRL